MIAGEAIGAIYMCLCGLTFIKKAIETLGECRRGLTIVDEVTRGPIKGFTDVMMPRERMDERLKARFGNLVTKSGYGCLYRLTTNKVSWIPNLKPIQMQSKLNNTKELRIAPNC